MLHTPHKINPWIAAFELLGLVVLLVSLFADEPTPAICGLVIYVAATRMRFTELVDQHTTYFAHRKRPMPKSAKYVGAKDMPPGWSRRKVKNKK